VRSSRLNENTTTHPSLWFEGSPKRRPLAWARWASLSETSMCLLYVVSPRRELVTCARDPSCLSESSLAWARLTRLVGYMYVSHFWMIGCFKQFKYDVLYDLYDILGSKLMKLGMDMKHDWMVGYMLTWDLVCMIILCLVGETWLWYGLGRNSMTLLVGAHGGASWFRA